MVVNLKPGWNDLKGPIFVVLSKYIVMFHSFTVKCPILEAPNSGYINITSDGSVTIAMFVCDQGYYIDGSSDVTCGTDGTWSAVMPTCSKIYMF
jgi:hypothetical protein